MGRKRAGAIRQIDLFLRRLGYKDFNDIGENAEGFEAIL
jgi:hypothetical protein